MELDPSKPSQHLKPCMHVFVQGTWKLGSFGFALSLAPNEAGPNASTVCPYYVNPMARKVRNGLGYWVRV